MAGLRPRPLFLVADDAPVVSQLVVELLKDAGVDVLGPAPDGLEAVRLYQQGRPDGAVLDFDMPGANGLDVLRTIRAEPHATPCTVIMLTAHAEPSLRQACVTAGADHFLTKSEFERLSDIVADHARRWEMPQPACRQSADKGSDI